jgi:hypothetical protein
MAAYGPSNLPELKTSSIGGKIITLQRQNGLPLKQRNRVSCLTHNFTTVHADLARLSVEGIEFFRRILSPREIKFSDISHVRASIGEAVMLYKDAAGRGHVRPKFSQPV